MNAKALMQKLFATFPNGNASPATVLVYVERLSSIPERELEAIVNQCIDTCEFLPTIAKLKEMHRQLHNPTNPDKAAEGWLSVQRAMRDPNTYTPEPSSSVPKFSDPLVTRAVESLGWYNLRMSTNPVADRAQFLKFYEAFANGEAGEQRLSPEFKALRNGHIKMLEGGNERD